MLVPLLVLQQGRGLALGLGGMLALSGMRLLEPYDLPYYQFAVHQFSKKSRFFSQSGPR